jgi:epoxyqueuosine reductase
MTDESTRVKTRAAELGFTLVGITTAEPFEADLTRTLDWLDRGFHAGMAWMSAERAGRACHPAELLPGAKSIVVVGAGYNGQQDEPAPGPTRRGRVARYARGVDYHDVMKARLTDLAETVREIGGPETRTRIFVDSSPLPERAAALRAGLGFVGKNTNLLTARAGSWLLLGALLTDLALTPDPPVERDCGRCRLCLDACPTGALPEPFLLDANRCISYLTIEHRDAIPHELRPQIGDHVFGCDICQDVCPWNRSDRGPGWIELSGPTEAGRPTLAEILALDDEQFRQRYRRTPLWRTKRRGLLRNAAVALGNIGDERDLPALGKALDDPEPLVRCHAAWAVGQIGHADGRAILEAARSHECDPDVLAEIDAALANLAPALDDDPTVAANVPAETCPFPPI